MTVSCQFFGLTISRKTPDPLGRTDAGSDFRRRRPIPAPRDENLRPFGAVMKVVSN